MKKRGFTLVELLAVIIILAVIALIATPLVLDVVDSAKRSAAESSAFGFAEAARTHWIENEFTNASGASLTKAKLADIEIQGAKPENCTADSDGYIITYDDKGRVSFSGCEFNGYALSADAGEISFDDESNE